MSDTWETLVPEAAPRYSTLPPGLMWMLSTPASTEAASLDLKGFHTLYSVFSPSPASTLILFSLYTLQSKVKLGDCSVSCGSASRWDNKGVRETRGYEGGGSGVAEGKQGLWQVSAYVLIRHEVWLKVCSSQRCMQPLLTVTGNSLAEYMLGQGGLGS